VPREYAAVSRVSIGPITSTEPLDRFDAAQSKRRGIDIFSWRSDQFFVASPAGLDKVCAATRCIYYRKHCEETACEYVLSEPVDAGGDTVDLGFAGGLSIRAPSRTELHRIVARLGFVVARGGRGAPLGVPLGVPLSRLSEESANLKLPSCFRSIWMQGCSRPSRPELRAREHP